MSFNPQTELQNSEMSSWSVEIVLYALNKHNLIALIPVFRDQDISGISLGLLTDSTLKDFGISSFGQRVKLLSMIEEYKKRDSEGKSAERSEHVKVRQQLTDILAFIEPSIREEAVNTLLAHDCYDLFSLKLLSATDYEKNGYVRLFFEW